MLVERITLLCEKENISLSELERRTGLGRGIYRWNVSAPSIDKLAKVAAYFGVSVDYLIGAEEEPQPDSVDEALEQLHKNPELRTLLSASANLSKEDIAFVTELVSRMKNQK